MIPLNSNLIYNPASASDLALLRMKQDQLALQARQDREQKEQKLRDKSMVQFMLQKNGGNLDATADQLARAGRLDLAKPIVDYRTEIAKSNQDLKDKQATTAKTQWETQNHRNVDQNTLVAGLGGLSRDQIGYALNAAVEGGRVDATTAGELMDQLGQPKRLQGPPDANGQAPTDTRPSQQFGNTVTAAKAGLLEQKSFQPEVKDVGGSFQSIIPATMSEPLQKTLVPGEAERLGNERSRIGLEGQRVRLAQQQYLDGKAETTANTKDREALFRRALDGKLTPQQLGALSRGEAGEKWMAALTAYAEKEGRSADFVGLARRNDAITAYNDSNTKVGAGLAAGALGFRHLDMYQKYLEALGQDRSELMNDWANKLSRSMGIDPQQVRNVDLTSSMIGGELASLWGTNTGAEREMWTKKVSGAIGARDAKAEVGVLKKAIGDKLRVIGDNYHQLTGYNPTTIGSAGDVFENMKGTPQYNEKWDAGDTNFTDIKNNGAPGRQQIAKTFSSKDVSDTLKAMIARGETFVNGKATRARPGDGSKIPTEADVRIALKAQGLEEKN